MLTARLLGIARKLRKRAQEENSNEEEAQQNTRDENSVWNSLSSDFKNWLQDIGIREVEKRLDRPWSHPKIQKAVNALKQKIQSEIDKLIDKLNKNSPDLQSNAETLTEAPSDYVYDASRDWDGSQKFAEDTPLQGKDKVIAIHFSFEKFKEITEDPLLASFLEERSNHFQGISTPLGWALVYIDPDKRFAAINQIQTDILNKYKGLLEKKSEEPHQQRSLSEDEVLIRLRANNFFSQFEALIDIDSNDIETLLRTSGLLDFLSNNPEKIQSLPRIRSLSLPEIEAEISAWLERKKFEEANFDNSRRDQGKLRKTEEEKRKQVARRFESLLRTWPEIVYESVKQELKDLGIKELYMNTSETVAQTIQNPGKLNYFYEQVPRSLGFAKQEVDIGRGHEKLWHTTLARLRLKGMCRTLTACLKRNRIK